MAKARFKQRTNEIIKSKYVEKKTFKRGLFAFSAVSSLLGLATYRLYNLGEFKGILTLLTTYYASFEHYIKGLF